MAGWGLPAKQLDRPLLPCPKRRPGYLRVGVAACTKHGEQGIPGGRWKAASCWRKPLRPQVISLIEGGSRQGAVGTCSRISGGSNPVPAPLW